MTPDPFEALVEKLCSGDVAAAEQVVREYQPYLRMIVRRQLPRKLQAKFDSVDVVQSVWVHVLHGFRDAGWHFENASRLRAFLVKVTRNRLSDRLRHFHTAAERERSFDAVGADKLHPSRSARPSEIAQAGDLWTKMLGLCSPEHQEVLRLKRRGLPLAEIAARTGFHEDSVRRIIRRVARHVAIDSPSISPPPELEV